MKMKCTKANKNERLNMPYNVATKMTSDETKKKKKNAERKKHRVETFKYMPLVQFVRLSLLSI